MSTAPAHRAPPSALPRRSLWVLIAALVCGNLWLASLPAVRLAAMDGWGLLPALPVTWYLALAGVLAVHVGALLSSRRVGHDLAACHVVLVALLFGTTSVVYDVPRYSYAYKHIGVVDYLLAHGTVDRSIDIYQNFPGFFYAAGLVHLVTTVPVIDLARWAQPAFALTDAAAVYWLAGGISTSRRTRYGAALVYTLGDWVGQNYFAPQALAFPLSLFVLGGLLRSAPRGLAAVRWPAHPAFRAAADARDLPEPSSFWRSWRGALVLLLAFACVTVSHQISPVILIEQSALLCLGLRTAWPWMPVAFAAVEGAWLAQAWPYLSSHFDLFHLAVQNAAPPQVPAGHALAGQAVLLWAAPVLMALLAALAAAAVVLALLRRRPGRVLLSAALALAPALVVLGQPYGHEALFRAYLFALPWAACLIAPELFGWRARVTPRRRTAVGVTAGVLAVLLLPACFASELLNHVRASDVAADAWFERQTPAGSLLLPVTSTLPVRSTERYWQHYPVTAADATSLEDVPGFTSAVGDSDRLVALTRATCAARTGAAPVYVAVGPGPQDALRLYGTMSRRQYSAYVSSLLAAPDFTRAFQDGSSILFRCPG